MSRRILIIDDESNIRRMMRLTLETAGYDVEDAADGRQGLERFGDGRGFSAVLLDQKMPDLEGLEVLKQIKQRAPAMPVVMVTAFATIDLAVDAMKLGASDFVRKPMTPETLRQAVDVAIGKGEVARPSPQPAQEPAADQVPPVGIWTTNGFFVRRVDRTADQPPHEHRFRLRLGRAGAETDVTVIVQAREATRVARLAGRDLDPAGSFWRQQAERALVDHLWREAQVPPGGRLVLDRVSGRTIDEASTWKGD